MEIKKVPDMAVYKGGVLHSLRDQKILKEGNLCNFGEGSGIVKEDKLYVLDEGITEIVRMIEQRDRATLNIECKKELMIDWGDGSKNDRILGPGSPTSYHFYNDGIKGHTIKVYGHETSLIALATATQLTLLDVSKNIELTRLESNGNQLSSLDVSNNLNLSLLRCGENQLPSLDVSKNTELTLLDCSGNPLSSLDLSKNIKLTYLNCSGSQLSFLDVSKNTELTHLDCSGSQLSSLDVSKNIKLIYLACQNTPLALDINILLKIANDLPDRTGKEKGIFVIPEKSKYTLSEICDPKNWSAATSFGS